VRLAPAPNLTTGGVSVSIDGGNFGMVRTTAIRAGGDRLGTMSASSRTVEAV
jgi:hypothetical protein